MDDRFNTAAGWTLFAGIVALGGSIVSGMYFQADKHPHVEKPGFALAGGEEAAGGGAGEMGIAEAMHMDGVDVSKGEKVFTKCAACHTANQGGADGIGPNLFGVVGGDIGKGGFAFSPALSGKGGKWDFDSLNDWLKNPRAFADGTKMTFAGLPKVEDRAAVILYLNAQGSNLPVPDFVAEAAAAAEEGAEGAEAEAPAVEAEGAAAEAPAAN
ncbi:MAG: cytochrome c family protein [Erythrobacter sp.]|jgi:cytochrome c